MLLELDESHRIKDLCLTSHRHIDPKEKVKVTPWEPHLLSQGRPLN